MKKQKVKSKVKRPESIYTNDGGIPFGITLIGFLAISVILMIFMK
jgi:hypothetical protein